MTRYLLIGATLALLAGPAAAQNREASTVAQSIEVLGAQSAIPLRGIPPALLQEAQGVAIVPGVVKAGFVVGGRFGRGIIMVREPNGAWSNPVFVTLTGGSVGWQIGIQSTDVVLLFKTRSSLDRILQGKNKLTLGADAAVAAGPVGRQMEAATDGQLKAEIFSYSRSRGLFAGVSFEGAGILSDPRSNEIYYRVQGGQPANILAAPNLPVPAEVINLKNELIRLSAATPAAQEFVQPGTPPPPTYYPQPTAPVYPPPLPAPTPIPMPPPPTYYPQPTAPTYPSAAPTPNPMPTPPQ